MAPVSESCVKRLLDLLPFYVREDVRLEVQKVVVPYVRTGSNDDEVTNFITQMIQDKKIRHGFYRVVKDLRLGKCDVPCAYTDEFR